MPLMMAPIGEIKTIVELRVKDELGKHLKDMGVIPGEKVKIMEENASGVILFVKGVKVAITKGLAMKIMVV